MLDEGFMAEATAKTVQQEREEVYAAYCLLEREWKDCHELKPKPKEKWIFVDQKREETKNRTEWCAEANKYRCMRCGRSSKRMKMPGKCKGPKYWSENWRKWRKRHLEGNDLVRRADRQGEVLIWCRKCSVHARQRMGPKLVDCCKLEHVDTTDHGKMLKRIPFLEDGIAPAKEANNWRIEGKRENYKEGMQKTVT